MADQKLRELTATTTPVSTDLVYLVIDPDGTPLDRKVEIGTLLGLLGAWVNLAMNSPGQIYGAGKDGNEPEWWDASGSATMTDEDTAGEGIPDRTERVFKVVTVSDDHYGYQTLTFANESLLDAGQTVVSFSCWVYCASANKASIGIYGTNLGLEESDQHTGGASWELLTVENVTLDAADTSIQLRLIVDTGTAYFTQPMLNVGSCSFPWVQRGLVYVPTTRQTVANGTDGDIAWSDADATATTHPLAVLVDLNLTVREPDGSAGSYLAVGHHDDIVGADDWVAQSISQVLTEYNREWCRVMVNDSQVFRYTLSEQDADSDVTWAINAVGYWRWAP